MKKTSRLIWAVTVLSILGCPSRASAADIDDQRRGRTLNESAIQKTRSGNLDGAEYDLLQALVYSDQNPRIRKNLGVVYYEKGVRALNVKKDVYEAARYLGMALEIDPAEARYKKAFAAALFLEANIKAAAGRSEEALKLYEKAAGFDPTNAAAWAQAAHYAWVTQKLDLARRYYEKAKALDPANKNVAILEERMKNSSAESVLETRNSEHFILSADSGYLDEVGSHKVLYDLEEAFNAVSYKLSIYPKNKIPVVFYPIKEFREHWRLPARVNAYYDGKLRIPVAGSQVPSDVLKPILMHELTHAFIQGVISKPIPQWLNEGVAQWVEGRSLDKKQRDALLTYEVARRAPDLAHLDATLAAQSNPHNGNEMTVAYMKSFSFVDFLVERHGIWKVMQLVRDLGAGQSSETVFRERFGESLGALESQWKDWLSRK